MKIRSLACFKFQVISYYNVYMYVYILSFSIPCTSSARNMHHGAQSSAQGACCLDIGFRHMSSIGATLDHNKHCITLRNGSHLG